MSTKATHLYFAAVHDGSHRPDHDGSARTGTAWQIFPYAIDIDLILGYNLMAKT